MGTVDKVGGGLRSSTLLDFIVDCCGYFADLEIAARGAQYRHTYVNPRPAFHHIADGGSPSVGRPSSMSISMDGPKVESGWENSPRVRPAVSGAGGGADG